MGGRWQRCKADGRFSFDNAGRVGEFHPHEKLLTAFALLIAACVPSFSAETAKPNVILIISDDHGFNDYGFMGHEIVKTPHLDSMAAESLLYTRGYVMPVCSPTLACLLTGKMPSANGITGNDLSGGRSKPGQREALREQLLGNSLTLPKAVTEAGYLTFQTGKIWNGTYQQMGFTHGMTNTPGRHGDAGLDIGRKGMKPIYDFIETAKAEKSPSSSGTRRSCRTPRTTRPSGCSRNTVARGPPRRRSFTTRWSIGWTRPPARWTRIWKKTASRKTP